MSPPLPRSCAQLGCEVGPALALAENSCETTPCFVFQAVDYLQHGTSTIVNKVSEVSGNLINSILGIQTILTYQEPLQPTAFS